MTDCRRKTLYRGLLLLALSWCAAEPSQAQERETSNVTDSTEELQVAQAARTAQAAVGEVGQRQTRAHATSSVAPMDRISSRVQNRVENRLRNRLDRFYDPKANATTPFERASAEAREAGGRSRRR